jgi:hypothetical protein
MNANWTSTLVVLALVIVVVFVLLVVGDGNMIRGGVEIARAAFGAPEDKSKDVLSLLLGY